jgi:hypothetical protein
MHKKDIKASIVGSDLYSKSEKLVLLELVSIAVDFVAVSSAKSLREKTGLSTTTTYAALKSLKNRKIIIPNMYEPNSYSFNKEELSRLLEIHKNKL